MSSVNEFVTVSDAPKYHGVSANTLRNWGREGKMLEYRHPINNYRLFKMSELEQLREKLAQPPLIRQA